MPKRDRFGRDIQKFRDYQREYMRNYRKEKKAKHEQLKQLIKESYDPFMDSVIIPRKKLEEVNYLSSRPSRTWYLDENIGEQKLIKVRIKGTVSNFIVGSKTYLPGDVVEVPEENFSPSFMEKVEPPKEPVVKEESTPDPSEEPVEATVKEEEPTETPTSAIVKTAAIQPKPRKVKRAKKK